MSQLRRYAPMVAIACALSASLAALTACGTSNSSARSAAGSGSATSSTAPSSAPAKVKAKVTRKSASAASVKVTLSEFKIVTSPTTATAGHVVFHVANTGKIKHQFTVIRTDKPASKALDSHNPDDDIPGARGEISSIQAGTSKTLVIKHLKAGHYALVCALPGHYQAGMHADFTVR